MPQSYKERPVLVSQIQYKKKYWMHLFGIYLSKQRTEPAQAGRLRDAFTQIQGRFPLNSKEILPKANKYPIPQGVGQQEGKDRKELVQGFKMYF